MTALARPRGPLPARVYWFRRGLLLLTVVALVVGVAKLAGGAGEDNPAAVLSGQQLQPAPGGELDSGGETDAEAGTDPDAQEEPQAKPNKKKKKKQPEPEEEPLPEPEGACAPRDLVVTPVFDNPTAGSTVRIDLEFTTREALACTFVVDRASVIAKLTSGSDDIWTTRHCPGGLAKPQTVIARQEVPGVATMRWSARRSDAECSNRTSWALPGWYHLEVAAFGGEPAKVQFQLRKPQPKVVTKTTAPKPKNG
ncbi:hypothetical protein [Nocardioides limicola]|uniref:hypothetical protein n=1 Tax=Nocardioides limicola TaxID=2803368 RepID=UPI00193C1771|nr:hypothetical protein [Nocardioides sp. DJM-14]